MKKLFKIGRFHASFSNMKKFSTTPYTLYMEPNATRELLKKNLQKKPQVTKREKEIRKYVKKFNLCQNRRNAESVMTIIDDMRIQGIKKHARMYHAAINAAAAGKSSLRVNEITTMMTEDGIKIHPGLFAFIINAQRYSQNKRQGAIKAKEYFNEFIKLHKKPTHMICASLVNVYVEAKDLKGVESVVSYVEENSIEVDGSFYGGVLKIYAQKKRFKKAKECIEKMKSMDHSDSSTTSTYTMLLRSTIKMEETIKIFGEMENEGIPGNLITWNTLLHKLEKAKRWNDVYKYYDLLRDAGLKGDKFTYTVLFRSAEKDNLNVIRARAYYNEMRARWKVDPEDECFKILKNIIMTRKYNRRIQKEYLVRYHRSKKAAISEDDRVERKLASTKAEYSKSIKE